MIVNEYNGVLGRSKGILEKSSVFNEWCNYACFL